MRRKEDPSRLPSSPLAPELGDDLISSSLCQELRRLAVGKLRFKRTNHTLQPTALVNAAYLRPVARFNMAGPKPRARPGRQRYAPHSHGLRTDPPGRKTNYHLDPI